MAKVYVNGEFAHETGGGRKDRTRKAGNRSAGPFAARQQAAQQQPPRAGGHPTFASAKQVRQPARGQAQVIQQRQQDAARQAEPEAPREEPAPQDAPKVTDSADPPTEPKSHRRKGREVDGGGQN